MDKNSLIFKFKRYFSKFTIALFAAFYTMFSISNAFAGANATEPTNQNQSAAAATQKVSVKNYSKWVLAATLVGGAAIGTVILKSLLSSTDQIAPLTGAETPTGTNEQRAKIFKDTLKALGQMENSNPGRYLNSSRSYSLMGDNGKILPQGTNYQPRDIITQLPSNRNGGKSGKIIVRCGRSLAVVNDLIKKGVVKTGSRIGVLNFANYYCPGGGVTQGCRAQEESLCRISDLYGHLIKLRRNFYQSNLINNINNLGGDRGLYTRNVKQIRPDIALPENFLPEKQQLEFDCLTVAAPDLRNHTALPYQAIKALMVRRVKLTVAMAIANKVNVLTLGALGCGAFRVPPEIASEAFREVLINEGYASYFDTIIFPILVVTGANNDLSNYEIFSEKFKTIS